MSIGAFLRIFIGCITITGDVIVRTLFPSFMRYFSASQACRASSVEPRSEGIVLFLFLLNCNSVDQAPRAGASASHAGPGHSAAAANLFCLLSDEHSFHTTTLRNQNSTHRSLPIVPAVWLAATERHSQHLPQRHVVVQTASRVAQHRRLHRRNLSWRQPARRVRHRRVRHQL